MPDFRHVITLAYNRILLRNPDAGGLQSFNQAMNAGLTEAQLHEVMLRSPEYAQRFPQAATRARVAHGGRAGRAGNGRKKSSRKSRS
jgi:hypothetical protein